MSHERVQNAVSAPAPEFEEYLEALLKAPPFETAPRRAGLLHYLVEKSLAGEADSLNEYAIALEVFGKPESFDQRIDSSVRSEISRLRKIVAAYYDGPGAEDRWRIVFPARGYVPQIEAAEPPTSGTDFVQAPAETSARWPWGLLVAGCAAGVALLLGVLGWDHVQARKFSQSQRGVARSVAPPATPAAQAFYLKGQYYLAHRTEANLRHAVDAFTQAIVADSSDAEAYAGLAECYDLMPEYSSVTQGDSFARAIATANKALALDPENAVAHRALGFGLYWSQTDMPRAFKEMQEAIRLAPDDADAHHWYATALNATQRHAEANTEIDRAQQLAPASRAILADQAWIRYSEGDAQAAARLQELEDAEPDFIGPPKFLARIALKSQNYPGYLDQLARVAALSGDAAQQRLAAAAKKGFARGGAIGMLQTMKALQEDTFAKGQTDGYELAHLCALLGEKQEAVRYLQRAFAANDLFVVDVLDPEWAPALNGYPPFEEFRQRVRVRFFIA